MGTHCCDALRRPVDAERRDKWVPTQSVGTRDLQFAICNLHLLLLVAGMTLPPVAAAQQLQPPKIVGVRVGIADRYKAGLWTQVEVTLRGGSERLAGELSVIVPDGDGVPGRAEQALPGPARPRDHRPADHPLRPRGRRLGGRVPHRPATVVARRVVRDRRCRPTPSISCRRWSLRSLIVVVGDSTLGMDEVGKLGGGEPEARPVAARVDDIERLPTHWCGYEGVDAVVLSTSRPEIYRKLAANNARVQALDQWVRMGGRLVLCVGSQADEILAQDSPLAAVRPRPAREDGLAARDRGVGNLLRKPRRRCRRPAAARRRCECLGWPTCRAPSRPPRPTCRWWSARPAASAR